MKRYQGKDEVPEERVGLGGKVLQAILIPVHFIFWIFWTAFHWKSFPELLNYIGNIKELGKS